MQFLKRLVILFIHLLTLSGAVALRQGMYADDNMQITLKQQAAAATKQLNLTAARMTTPGQQLYATTTSPLLHVTVGSSAKTTAGGRSTTPDDGDYSDEIEEGVEAVRYAFEVATLLGCLAYLFIQLGGEIMNQGLKGFLRSLVIMQTDITEKQII